MESASLEKLIEISRIGVIASAVLFVLGVALAVFLFFKYDIRKIYAIRSGRDRKTSVKNISQKAFKTGPVGTNINLDYESGTLKSWLTGSTRQSSELSTGGEVTDASSGGEGTSVLQNTEPDSITTDNNAPDNNIPIENETINEPVTEPSAPKKEVTFTEEAFPSVAADSVGFRVIDEIVLIHTQECA